MSSRKKQDLDEISGRAFDRRVVLRLLPYLRPHRPAVAFALFLVLLSAGVALYAPRLLGRIVDQALLPRDHHLLAELVLLFAGLEVARIAAVYGQSYGLQKIGQQVMQAVRRDLYSRLIHMPVPFFDQHPVGKLVTRVTNDTVNLGELFSGGFVMLLSDFLVIAGVIGMMLALHPLLGLIAVSVFPLMIAVMVTFSERLRITFRGARDVLSRLNAVFAEHMQGMAIVQLMEREEQEKAAYRELSEEYRDRQFDGIFLYSLFHPAITILSGLSVALVLWYGPGFLAKGEIDLGVFVSFLAYVQVLYQPVRNITDRYNVFLTAMASAERIFTLMDMPEEAEIRDKPGARSGRGSGALHFEDVTFSYPSLEGDERPPALRGVSFGIEEGETVAVVGHTGAGKTTLTSLLFRFYEPSRGRITLGGRPLAEIPKRELRERIGFVQQEVFLFSGSLRDNLTLLRLGLTDARLLDACARTGLIEVVERLPRGLDTQLDERGANLSMGERQVLAFTRVFVQDPELLVLDEASSSVDLASERKLQAAALALCKGRPALVIAHRLETVKTANRIVVLEQGAIAEAGAHEGLLRAGGRYAHFVRLQEQIPH